MFYNTKAKEILDVIIDELKKSEKAQGATLLAVYKHLRAADDIVIDCATKLAPYQSPKLESIEVNKKVEHRYVIRAPQQSKSTQDWVNLTGANKEDNKVKVPYIKPPAPFTIHDMESMEQEDIDDEDINEQRRTLQ